MPVRISEAALVQYIRRFWPRLWIKLRVLSDEERTQRLDDLTLLEGSKKLDREAACGRWYFHLRKMYEINGDLEF